jgi:hypothetical protein
LKADCCIDVVAQYRFSCGKVTGVERFKALTQYCLLCLNANEFVYLD